MNADTTESDKSDQNFEITAASLLGLAAIASAWTGHQAGLWGGNCLTAYTEAGQMTTDASTIYQEAGAEAIRDSSLDIQAKQIIAEGNAIKDVDLRDAKMDIARYLYTQQLSDDAYTALQLPPAARSDSEDAWNALPEEALLNALDNDLDDDYWEHQLSAADDMYTSAEAKFSEGRKANGIGDQFGFVGVLLTVSMFFLGISLVFKSKARWGLLGAGGLILVGSSIMLLTLPSAGSGLPSAAPADTKAEQQDKAEPSEDEPAPPEPATVAPIEPAPAPAAASNEDGTAEDGTAEDGTAEETDG